jgi:hypothetical protein
MKLDLEEERLREVKPAGSPQLPLLITMSPRLLLLPLRNTTSFRLSLLR